MKDVSDNSLHFNNAHRVYDERLTIIFEELLAYMELRVEELEIENEQLNKKLNDPERTMRDAESLKLWR